MAIIDSMTPRERREPSVINGSRRKRIAKGSGTAVEDVNRLLKQFVQARKLMKQFGGGGGKAMKQLAARMPAAVPVDASSDEQKRRDSDAVDQIETDGNDQAAALPRGGGGLARAGATGASSRCSATTIPRKNPAVVKIDAERAQYWIGKGAQPSDTVRSLLKKQARGGQGPRRPSSHAHEGAARGARAGAGRRARPRARARSGPRTASSASTSRSPPPTAAA